MGMQDSSCRIFALARSLLREMACCPFFAAVNLPERYRCGTEPFSCSVERLYPRESRGWNPWHNRDFAKVTIMLATYFIRRCVFSSSAVSGYLAGYGLFCSRVILIQILQTMCILQNIHIPYGFCSVHSKVAAIKNEILFDLWG